MKRLRAVIKRPLHLCAVAVALLTFVVYLPALHNGFVLWDDGDYVFQNIHIRSFNKAFFKWAFLGFHASNWHPVTWISHAFDFSLWRLNPAGHHLTNILLHSINAFAIVLVAAYLMEVASASSTTVRGSKTGFSRRSIIAATMTGLLFGLHPVQVESVAWVSERKNLLSTLFFLSSICAYVKLVSETKLSAGHTAPSLFRPGSLNRKTENAKKSITTPKSSSGRYGGKRSIVLYLLSFSFFVLALMSKPMAVTLPVVLLIFDWYPFRRVHSLKSFWTCSVEKLPFFVMSALSAFLTILAQASGDAIQSVGDIPLRSRAVVAGSSLVAYLTKLAFPVNLSPFYPYPGHVSLFSPAYFCEIVIAVIITAACAAAARRQRFFLAVWLYYVVTLLPVLGIIQVGGQAMADRYLYIPALGPMLAASLGAAFFWERVNGAGKKAAVMKIGAAAAASVILGTMTFLTIAQINVWKASLSLWNRAIEKSPEKVSLLYENRGVAYASIGMLDKALSDYNTAISLDPSHYETYFDRGTALQKIGLTDRALADFSTAVSLNPRCYQAFNNIGTTYLRKGLYEDGLREFSQAISVKPDFTVGYINRGLSYYYLGRYDAALEDLNSAIGLDPSYAQAYATRGMVYLGKGEKEKATSDFRVACGFGDRKACGFLQSR